MTLEPRRAAERRKNTGGGISAFQISVFAGIAGVAFLVFWLVVLSVDQQAQRQPLEITPPSNAELREQVDVNSTNRRLYYVIPNSTAEDVVAYYDQQMLDFYGADASNSERCRRLPGSGNYDNFQAGNGSIPYQYRCLFDTANFQGDRITEVVIHPGVRNNATGDNFEGSVIVEYLQQWQP
ncbi:MAG: hypothetical protein MUF87_04440 [Anaerolineae bacterium]|jgi:hypothetical protein|nr:hypothetical protein [Anaerolineae bacterium]